MSPYDEYLREIGARGYREEDAPRFRAAWYRLEAGYFARLQVATASAERWRERFRAAATETVRLVETHPAEARFLAVDALMAGQLGRECQNALASRLAELLDSARAELDDPGSVPAATSGWIVGIFFSRVHRRCTNKSGPDLPSQLPELMFLAVSAYFGTEAGVEELIARA